jgi:hypothetical protein
MKYKNLIQYFKCISFLILIKSQGVGQTHSKIILIDEGHYNFHTLSSGYKTFAELQKENGHILSEHRGLFTKKSINKGDVLVIVNPLPFFGDSLQRIAFRNNEPTRYSKAATKSAFSSKEIQVVRNWVKKGGSLLLILDHAPHGAAGKNLAAAFGVESRNVETTDSIHKDSPEARFTILFTRSNNMIGEHPITLGVDSIVTYLGESLLGPESSTSILRLIKPARERDWLAEKNEYRYRPADGRSQGIALEFGNGRVVVLGEAGMLISSPGINTGEKGNEGIARPDRGNKIFAINLINWLIRLDSL